MKILTIVVPSYNISKHIDRCVPHYMRCKNLDKIEILFVNDGSKDDTLDKLKVYEDNHFDSIKIISKENGGHGSAVNEGIKVATGKYFKVIDGDDWIETENLDRLVLDLEKMNSDLVLNPYYKVSQITHKKKIFGIWNVKKYETIYFNELPRNISGLQLHEWTIKTEILKSNHIHFTEKCYYDDFEYITYPVPYINTITFFEYPVYDYLVDQATQSVSDKNAYKNSYMSRMIIFETIRYYKKNRPNSVRANQYFFDTIINGCKQHYNIYLRNANEAEAYDRWREFDRELSYHKIIYNAVGRRFFYILLIRKFGRPMFLINSKLIKFYKSLKRMY